MQSAYRIGATLETIPTELKLMIASHLDPDVPLNLRWSEMRSWHLPYGGQQRPERFRALSRRPRERLARDASALVRPRLLLVAQPDSSTSASAQDDGFRARGDGVGRPLAHHCRSSHRRRRGHYICDARVRQGQP